METTTTEERTPALTLGWRLRMARAQADLTADTAADTIGVARGTVSMWEMDKTVPSYPNMRALAALYRVPLDWLGEGVR